LPLGYKAVTALTGDGKNGAAAAVNSAAEQAAKAQPNAAASSDSAAAATAQALAGGGDAGAAIATLKDNAEAARAALAATQTASAAGAASAAAQAAAAAGSPNMAAAAAALAPPVGTPDWEDALSQKVVFLSNAHQQSAELTLNPPDLGPLQVVLQVADNHAHALFVSQHQQVREAVEAALPKLRDALEAGGLGLGSASVSDGFARQANQQQAGNQSGGSGRRGGGGGSAASGGQADDTISAVKVSTRRTVGLVDTFA
jgi:flagellar hook-length control protein FliK